jgi:hypothetical protein
LKFERGLLSQIPNLKFQIPFYIVDQSIHLDLDGAWDAAGLKIRTLDLRDFGPRLRYFASAGELDSLSRQLPRELPPFVLYGSGDFHYLSGLWVSRAV